LERIAERVERRMVVPNGIDGPDGTDAADGTDAKDDA
jgi:hypothetical protein